MKNAVTATTGDADMKVNSTIWDSFLEGLTEYGVDVYDLDMRACVLERLRLDKLIETEVLRDELELEARGHEVDELDDDELVAYWTLMAQQGDL